MQFLFLTLILACTVLGNTEVHLIKVPNYYNVPMSVENISESPVMRTNDTTLVLLHHPIISIDSPGTSLCQIKIPYDFQLKPKQRLYVKINNYGNVTYKANDLLQVKFCWPATTPLSFHIDHAFLKNKELLEDVPSSQVVLANQLEIYLVIDIEADFYAVKHIEEDSFSALLHIAKLPNSVPIPLELYDFILYGMDLLILSVATLPYLHKAFHALIFSE